MSDKVETYKLSDKFTYPQMLKELINELNGLLAKLEDRLDDIEAVRGEQYFTTTRWEKDEVKGE